VQNVTSVFYLSRLESPSFQMEQHIRNLKRTSSRSADNWPMSNSNSVNLTLWNVALPYRLTPEKRPGNLLSHHYSAAYCPIGTLVITTGRMGDLKWQYSA